MCSKRRSSNKDPPDLVIERPHQNALLENPSLATHPVFTLLIHAGFVLGKHSIKRGQMCTLFSARFLALATSPPPPPPFHAFFPPPPLYSFHTKWIKVSNHEPQEGSSNAEMSRRTKCTFERCTFVTPWFKCWNETSKVFAGCKSTTVPEAAANSSLVGRHDTRTPWNIGCWYCIAWLLINGPLGSNGWIQTKL